MDKITLEFTDIEQAQHAINGVKYSLALDDIWEKVFRPNNKHSYGNKILDKEESYEVIEELMKIYQEVIGE